jgi:flagellar hook-basal body complex protein FliE
MSQMEIDRVLAQIRAISGQARMGGSAPANPLAATGGPSFATLLKSGVDQVNASQQRAGALATAFERGTPGVDLPQVMLEIQKASVSLRAVTEVRNRFVSAYQEIMNMPI